MINRLRIRNFKLLDDVDLELDSRVVFVGPNNSGKTSVLQALAVWNVGVRKWVEKRGNGPVPVSRSGVTINRRDLLAVPVPAANLLWRQVHTRQAISVEGKQKTTNVLITIEVDGMSGTDSWSTALEFDYANEESIYCRSRLNADGARREIPDAAVGLKVAYLPPMSGLSAVELRLDEGAIGVRIGEGRTAEVLRNLAWIVFERDRESWKKIVEQVEQLFGARLNEPEYISERGEIELSYVDRPGTRLDISSAGRGQQQTLLLLSHMTANPGALLLLDEPDAHLETLRQRETYRILSETAEETGSQLICASHSEVILDEAAQKDTVVAFVGKPHVAAGGTSQLRKSLSQVSFSDYLQAEQTRWVLFLEGTTDLDFLRAFAVLLDHPALQALERPYVVYTANEVQKARGHYHALREAVPDLRGIGIYDRMPSVLESGSGLDLRTWCRYEIENYLDLPAVLISWAKQRGAGDAGDLFVPDWVDAMEHVIAQLEDAEGVISGESPWSHDKKASEKIERVFELFAKEEPGAQVVRKSRFHQLVQYMEPSDVDNEIVSTLDAISQTASI
jgi:ABC-type multidrug transport system ATPase subunit